MGDKVVFTVALDDDPRVEVAAARPDPVLIPTLRSMVRAGFHSRAWRVITGAAAVAPWLGVAVVRLVGGGSLPAESLVPVVVAMALACVAAAVGGAESARRTGGEDGAPAGRAALAVDAAVVLAGIGLGAVALAASLPALGWAITAAGFAEAQAVPMVAAAAVGLTVSALAGAVVSLALVRMRSSAAAAIAAVAIVVFPVLAVALALPLTVSEDAVSHHTFQVGFRDDTGQAYPGYVCDSQTVTVTRAHPESVAWMLTWSPPVAVLDAPSLPPTALADAPVGGLPWAQARLRETRLGPTAFEGFCYQPTSLGTPQAVLARRFEGGGANPWLIVAEITAMSCLYVGLSRRRRSSQ